MRAKSRSASDPMNTQANNTHSFAIAAINRRRTPPGIYEEISGVYSGLTSHRRPVQQGAQRAGCSKGYSCARCSRGHSGAWCSKRYSGHITHSSAVFSCQNPWPTLQRGMVQYEYNPQTEGQLKRLVSLTGEEA